MDYINFAQIDGLYTDHQRRIGQVIKDIFPTVRLIRMEPGHPSFDPEKPFALVDEPLMKMPYHIRNVAESEIDHRLVAWLVENNNHDPNSKANRLQLLEMANKLVNAKRDEEWQAEKRDLLESAMKSKHSWTHNGQTIRK